MTTKTLFFDAGPIITLVLSRLGWILPELKKKTNATFYITPAVKFELVDRPLNTKRFEFEALEVLRWIREGTLTVYQNVPEEKVSQLKKLANSSFSVDNRTMDVIQKGEMESVASALQEQAPAVIDERTLRLFIENNKEMVNLLSHRFQKKVKAHKQNMDQFSRSLEGVTIIRSVELAAVAYKLGLLESYVPQKVRKGREVLLDALLWATKYNGCAVTEHEINELKEFLLAK